MVITFNLIDSTISALVDLHDRADQINRSNREITLTERVELIAFATALGFTQAELEGATFIEARVKNLASTKINNLLVKQAFGKENAW